MLHQLVIFLVYQAEVSNIENIFVGHLHPILENAAKSRIRFVVLSPPIKKGLPPPIEVDSGIRSIDRIARGFPLLFLRTESPTTCRCPSDQWDGRNQLAAKRRQ